MSWLRKAGFIKKSINDWNKMICKVLFSTDRSNHRMCFARKGALKNFAKFTGKHLCQSLFFNIVAGQG